MAIETGSARRWSAWAVFAATLASAAGCGGGLGCAGPICGGGETVANYASPVVVTESLAFVAIEASSKHACGIATDGATYCWGNNEYGALGTSAAMQLCGGGAVPCTGTPQRVETSARFTALVLTDGGAGFTCGLTGQEQAWCWGFGFGEGVSDGTPTTRASSTPAPVAGDLRFAYLRASMWSQRVCGLARDGETYCWRSGSGQSPERMAPNHRFIDMDIAQLHSCGLGADGRAYCWGSNWYGQLGIGSSTQTGGVASVDEPTPVLGGLTFRSIVTGTDFSCALTSAGVAYCWGYGPNTGTGVADPFEPREVAGNHVFVSLHAGGRHACGLTANGEAWCWGSDALGDGSGGTAAVPVRVRADPPFAGLAYRPYCGLTTEGRALCWGSNYYGQVGRPPNT